MKLKLQQKATYQQNIEGVYRKINEEKECSKISSHFKLGCDDGVSKKPLGNDNGRQNCRKVFCGFPTIYTNNTKYKKSLKMIYFASSSIISSSSIGRRILTSFSCMMSMKSSNESPIN